MTIRDWDIVASYIDTVGITDKTVTFPKVQDTVKVTNRGNANLIYTIGTKTGTLSPNASIKVVENMSSFVIRSQSSVQEFEVWALEAGTEKEDAVPTSNIPADISEQLEGFTSQLASKATQSDLDTTNANVATKATKMEVTNVIKNNTTPLKVVEKLADGLFNFDFTGGIKVIDSAVAGVKQLTIDTTTTQNPHTNVALYNVINNVRGYEVEFEPGTTGAKVRLGFADDSNNFIFLNFSSGEFFYVNNGVLETPSLNPTYTPVTIADGDRFKLIFNGNVIQLFKNDVLIQTVIPNSPVYASKYIRNVEKKYPAISFRDGTATYAYGVNKLKVYQKSYPKFMHLSIDDEIWVLQTLTQQLPTSIFDLPTFSFMKYLHDTYGAVFTMNLFYKYYPADTFNLSSVTSAYANEFRANSDWLKFSFHGYDSVMDYDTLDAATAKTHWDMVMTEIVRFSSPQNIDTMPRTSGFKGNLANARAWRDTANNNATGFLAADDTRAINLYLGANERASLIACDDLYDGVEKLFFMRTDLRLDSAITPYATLDSRKTDKTFRGQQNAQIVFWHSSVTWSDTVKTNIEDCCKWARDNGYVFLYPMAVNPKF